MQCQHCEIPGFISVNQKGLCDSCEKAAFEAKVRAARKDGGLGYDSRILSVDGLIGDSGRLTLAQSKRFVARVIEGGWDELFREWTAVLIMEGDLPDSSSSCVIDITRDDDVWVTWRELDEFMATDVVPQSIWKVTPEGKEAIRSFVDDQLKGRHAPVEIVPCNRDNTGDGLD